MVEDIHGEDAHTCECERKWALVLGIQRIWTAWDWVDDQHGHDKWVDDESECDQSGRRSIVCHRPMIDTHIS